MAWKNWGDNPFVVAIGMIAGLAAVAVLGITVYDRWDKQDSLAPSTALSPSPVISPVNDNITLRLRVIDNNKKGLGDVEVIISSSGPSDSDLTDTDGYVEFQVPLNSSQVRLTLLKDGYEPLTRNNIDLKAYAKATKEFTLKKK
ncbi:MAG: carboxypeptidase regulatory-like domain-containing protein [Symploca sp. SIO2G7]|nr:carboxypeptidase regulatory-like domain-containing protein [Symploca sp. SIO2G7]